MQLRSPPASPIAVSALAAALAIAGCKDATTAPEADTTRAVAAMAGVPAAVASVMRSSVGDVTIRILPTLDGSAAQLRRAFEDLTDALDAGNAARIVQSRRAAQRALAGMRGANDDPELASIRVVLEQLEEQLPSATSTNGREAARQ